VLLFRGRWPRKFLEVFCGKEVYENSNNAKLGLFVDA
jgi:hypothetical protein